jgi:TPR repeat protein
MVIFCSQIVEAALSEKERKETMEGLIYVYVLEDLDNGMKVLKKSADNGNIISQRILGNLYFDAKNYGEAFKLYKKAAEQGDIKAQFVLGIMYGDGKGTTQNYSEKIKWYQKSAQNGYITTQMLLGIIYEEGKETPHNNEAAIQWYQKSAQQGDYVSQYKIFQFMVEKIIPVDYQKAFEYFYLSFFQVNYFQQMSDENIKAAVNLFQTGAKNNNAAAQSGLGLMYSRGWGFQKNNKESLKLYQKAAKQGFAAAQFLLGECYFYGEPFGIKQDYKESFEWVQKSAQQGNAQAQNKLGDLYKSGLGVEKDYAKASQWYLKAAEQGEPFAQINLAKMYIVSDKDKALFWLKKVYKNNKTFKMLQQDAVNIIQSNFGNEEPFYFTSGKHEMIPKYTEIFLSLDFIED